MIPRRYATVLVTGGAGFVGSNLSVAFRKKYPSVEVIALDNLKRRGSELNLPRLKDAGIAFRHGDVRNPEDLAVAGKVDLLIECSAEPSVLAGTRGNPTYVVNTNLVGTINCLEMARAHRADLVFLSTSRVYPFKALNAIKKREMEERFDWEDDQPEIAGWSMEGIDTGFTLSGAKSLYGATKLCSELLIEEYAEAYGLRAVINRCGVLAGPWQFGKVDQGICTYWMLSHYFRKPLAYMGFGGRGKQVRDILHADDLFDLIELQLSSSERFTDRIYNVGGGRRGSVSLRELTRICREITGGKVPIDSQPDDRPCDVAVYITDNKAVQRDLGWAPKRAPREILEEIFFWIRDNEQTIAKALELP